MMYVLLILGFVLLIKGADFFVEGSSSVAKMLKIPSVVVGLTIVSIGTSLPEASVSIMAGLTGNNDIALSNVIGSNIFNLLVVIGVCGVIQSFATDRDIMKRDMPVTIATAAVLVLFIINGSISRQEGAILLVLFAAYLVWLVRSALKNKTHGGEDEKILSPLMSTVYIIGGAAAVVIGGDLVVDNASLIAEAFGLSQTLIGLTIVAVGTSLPELVTSVMASRKGESGLALGNAVGSSIFNILFILGASSSLSPIEVSALSVIDAIFFLAVTVLLLVFVRSDKKLIRTEGAVCIAVYLAYMGYIIIR